MQLLLLDIAPSDLGAKQQLQAHLKVHKAEAVVSIMMDTTPEAQLSDLHSSVTKFLTERRIPAAEIAKVTCAITDIHIKTYNLGNTKNAVKTRTIAINGPSHVILALDTAWTPPKMPCLISIKTDDQRKLDLALTTPNKTMAPTTPNPFTTPDAPKIPMAGNGLFFFWFQVSGQPAEHSHKLATMNAAQRFDASKAYIVRQTVMRGLRPAS
ncbi:hypothetical protein HYH02_012482 [Chlamydomonas schloesseri]|uniref:Uncharacterized protein n=1 Tax=Chlamydomonas schloesseri TaxID=2026947 RepID=A0A835SYS0_9CHLO|nr:hypothetical protein HYH02_012482 [Chlamydomonas schloesseri]|eukprot:KAG2433937.1 hypothetical protein HYH02_012482 [Chlamydomonas schloesseri]